MHQRPWWWAAWLKHSPAIWRRIQSYVCQLFLNPAINSQKRHSDISTTTLYWSIEWWQQLYQNICMAKVTPSKQISQSQLLPASHASTCSNWNLLGYSNLISYKQKTNVINDLFALVDTSLEVLLIMALHSNPFWRFLSSQVRWNTRFFGQCNQKISYSKARYSFTKRSC